MKATQKLDGTITIDSAAETFWIREAETGFAVTSNRGCDTIGNGMLLRTLQEALGYVYTFMKNGRDEK